MDFLVTSAHNLQAVGTKEAIGQAGTSFWKLNMPQRVRVFMWQLAHNGILTIEARQERDLSLSGDFSRCAESS